MRADTTRRLLPALLLAMSATAWLAMWRLGDSSWAHWLHGHGAGHGAATAAGMAPFALAGPFVAGWLVMTAAMMLPTTLPLVEMFRRLTRARADRTALALLLVAGYLAAWLACGVAVYAAIALAQSAMGPDWTTHPRPLAATLFLVAGAFQFSTLKYQCLDKCRSPLSVLSSQWRGGGEWRQAFRIGVRHGLYCVGCCWALMLLMFAFGAVNLLWMLALAAVMAIEKNMPWGRRLSAPLGAVLIAAGLVLAVLPS